MATGHGEVDVSRSFTNLIKCFIKRIEPTDHMPETTTHPNRCDRHHLIIILRKTETIEDIPQGQQKNRQLTVRDIRNLDKLVTCVLHRSYAHSQSLCELVTPEQIAGRFDILQKETAFRKDLNDDFWAILQHFNAEDQWRRMLKLKEEERRARSVFVQESATQREVRRLDLIGNDGNEILRPWERAREPEKVQDAEKSTSSTIKAPDLPIAAMFRRTPAAPDESGGKILNLDLDD